MVKDVFTHKFSSPRSNCVMRCFKYVNRKLFKDLEVMQFNYFLKLFQFLHDLGIKTQSLDLDAPLFPCVIYVRMCATLWEKF